MHQGYVANTFCWHTTLARMPIQRTMGLDIPWSPSYLPKFGNRYLPALSCGLIIFIYLFIYSLFIFIYLIYYSFIYFIFIYYLFIHLFIYSFVYLFLRGGVIWLVLPYIASLSTEWWGFLHFVYIFLMLPRSWASYQIRKIEGCACAGNAGNIFPATAV